MKPCSYTSRVIVVHYGGFPQSYKIPHKIGSKSGEIPIQSLFTGHYSSVTIHCYCSSVTVHDTVHSEFCLFKGGCPLCLRAFLKHSLVLISLPLELAFLEREPTCFHYYYCSTTTLFILSLVILQTL